MNKTETMILKNKEANAKKVETAINCVKDMLKNDEQVVVCELVKRTGLSRAFFYNNEAVRAELDRAQGLQEGKSFVAPQKVAIDKALERKAELLEKKLQEKDKQIVELQKEIVKLKKAADSKAISIIKGL